MSDEDDDVTLGCLQCGVETIFIQWSEHFGMGVCHECWKKGRMSDAEPVSTV